MISTMTPKATPIHPMRLLPKATVMPILLHTTMSRMNTTTMGITMTPTTMTITSTLPESDVSGGLLTTLVIILLSGAIPGVILFGIPGTIPGTILGMVETM